MNNQTTGALAASVFLLLPKWSTAGSITVSAFDTDDIVIPMFDQSLGTLTSVDLNVTLRAGSTNVGGAHDHETYLQSSSNRRSDANVAPVSGTFSILAEGPFSYSIVTPSYSGGGLDLGQFSFDTAPLGAHSHTATYHQVGITYVHSSFSFLSGFEVLIEVGIDSSSGYAATFDSHSKDLSFTGTELSPFLGNSNIVIDAGDITTLPDAAHSHSLPEFSATVASSTGPWTWNFRRRRTNFESNQTLALDPRLDTTATFHFTPRDIASAPEPTSLDLFGLGALGLAGFRRRKSHSLNPVVTTKQSFNS